MKFGIYHLAYRMLRYRRLLLLGGILAVALIPELVFACVGEDEFGC